MALSGGVPGFVALTAGIVMWNLAGWLGRRMAGEDAGASPVLLDQQSVMTVAVTTVGVLLFVDAFTEWTRLGLQHVYYPEAYDPLTSGQWRAEFGAASLRTILALVLMFAARCIKCLLIGMNGLLGRLCFGGLNKKQVST